MNALPTNVVQITRLGTVWPEEWPRLQKKQEQEEIAAWERRRDQIARSSLKKRDLRHFCMEILKIHYEKIARKAGCQPPVENGQHMITESRLDEAGDSVRPCGAFTHSKDQPDATLFYRLPPNASIGPILSIRAFEFESLCGPDLLIPDQRDACGSPLASDKGLFYRQNGFDGTSKEGRQIRQSFMVDRSLVVNVCQKGQPKSSGTKKIVTRKTVRVLGQNTRSSSLQICQT